MQTAGLGMWGRCWPETLGYRGRDAGRRPAHVGTLLARDSGLSRAGCRPQACACGYAVGPRLWARPQACAFCRDTLALRLWAIKGRDAAAGLRMWGRCWPETLGYQGRDAGHRPAHVGTLLARDSGLSRVGCRPQALLGPRLWAIKGGMQAAGLCMWGCCWPETLGYQGRDAVGPRLWTTEVGM